MEEDSKGQRHLEDSGRGLLPAVEGPSLEQNRTEIGKLFRNFGLQYVCLYVVLFLSV